jgi:hypothetical protein
MSNRMVPSTWRILGVSGHRRGETLSA